jgi:hypothetical protein
MYSKPKRTFEHDFPFTEIAFIVFQFFVLVGSIVQYYKRNEIQYLFIAFVVLLILMVFYWITNWRNKKLYFKNDSLLIKPYFKRTEVIPYEQIEGYLLRETYSRYGTGLDYHIHIMLKGGRNINLIKEVYPEYERIQDTLNKLGIKYLGKRQMKWKYKGTYARLTVYSTTLVIILFLALQLIKFFK